MTLFEKTKPRKKGGQGFVALVTVALCAVGIAAYYAWSSSELRSIDAAMLGVMVLFLAYGTSETILRGVTTVISAYLSTAMAGLFCAALAPYSRSLLDAIAALGLRTPPAANPDNPALAVSFALAAGAIWLVLEFMFRAALPESYLVCLGFLDRVGGAALYLMIGVVVAALAFGIAGLGLGARSACADAALRPFFGRVMKLLIRAQSFWFTGQLPVVYSCVGVGY